LVPRVSGVLAVWLDGRKTGGYVEGSPGPTPDMTLRAAVVTPGGGLTDEAELDGRTCDCCQTAAASTVDGFLVAYRGRSPDEVRDIFLTRFVQGRWSVPRPVHGVAPVPWTVNICGII
jgi:hypothetical protein